MSDDDELHARLRVEAVDDTGPALRSISENIERTKRTFETLGSGMILGKTFTDFANLQRTMERLQFSTGATDTQMHGLKRTFEEISRSTGQSVDQLGRSFNTFLDLSGQGITPAIEQFKTLSEAAKITGASMEGLGRTAAAAVNDLKVPEAEISDLIKRWSVEMPSTMLDMFSHVAPRLMQTMESVGLTGRKNAEELGVVFSEVGKATGSPRAALMGLSSLFNSLNNAGSQFGKMMGPTMEKVAAGGGDLLDQMTAVYNELEKMGAYEPKNRRYLNEMFGLDANTLKTIQTFASHREQVIAALAKGGEASKLFDAESSRQAQDAKSALDALRASVEGLGDSFAHLVSNIGANKVIGSIAAGAESAAEAFGALGRKIHGDKSVPEDNMPTTFGMKARSTLSAIGGGSAAFIGGTLGSSVGPVGTITGGILGERYGEWAANRVSDYLGLDKIPTEEQMEEYAKEHGHHGIEHHSQGGIVRKPTLSTLAEDGPEAVIPLNALGSGGNDESTQATKDLTSAITRLTNEMREKDTRVGGQRLAYTPGAGEAPVPGVAQVYGSSGGYGGGGFSGGGGGAGSRPMGRLPGLGGGGGGSPGSDGHEAPISGNLAAQRAGFIKELEADPQLRDFAIDAMGHEGEIQSNMEQLFNYASMRHMTIRQALHSGQYGPVNTGRISGRISAKTRAAGLAALSKVGAGSNIVDYATDQGMAGDPNFAKYMANRSFYNMHKVNGAWFSYHGDRGRKWAERQRAMDSATASAHEDTSVFSHGAAAIPHLQHQSMLEHHRAMRAEMERPIRMAIHTPDMVGRRQRMQKLQSRMYAEDLIGTPRYASQLDIGMA